MPFSAGTVVLEVWPSFKNVQRQMAQEGREAGREFGRGLDRELDKTDDNAARAGAKAGGAFTRAMKAAIEKVPAKITADASPARRELWKLREEGKVILAGLEDGKIDLDTDTGLAQLRTFMARAQAIVRDGAELDVRTDAGAIRQALSDLIDFHERAIGETKREKAERLKIEKDAAKAQSDMLRDAYRENADFNAKRAVLTKERVDRERQAAKDAADAAAGETQIIRDRNDEVVQSYRNRAARLAQIAREARVAEKEAADQAVRTGTDADQAAAIAAIKRRYQAEGEAAREAARARTAASLAAGASERITAQQVQHSVRESYDEQVDAAQRAGLERIAIARIVARIEKASANGNGPSFLRQAWVQNIGQAANSFRLFNGALLTAITLGPLLIPILAAIAGGLGFVALAAMAAFAGIGVLVAGLAGIGGAVSALAEMDKEKKYGNGDATGGTKREVRGPTIADRRRLRDAELDLARAREDAGRRINDALDRQRDAEARLVDAQKDSKRAQQDLTRARREAVRELANMRGELRKGLINEQLAALDVEEAEAHYAVLLADPQATDREKKAAKLEVDKRKAELAEMRRENGQLRKQIQSIEKNGIDSTERVIDARRRLNDMNERVAESEERVADARAEVNRARLEEARTLFDAEQRYKDALEDMKPTIVETTTAGTAAFRNLREAIDQLSPAGERFARFLYGLKPLLDQLRYVAQEGLLPGLQQMIQTIVDEYGDDFVSFVGEMAKVVGDLAVAFGEEITSPWWREFFESMRDIAPGLLRDIATAIGFMAKGFAGIMQAFAPYADEFGDALTRVFGAFAEWGANLAESESFKEFMAYLQKSTPKVMKFLGLLAELVVNLFIGLAPYADKLLDLFIGLLEWLTSMDPSTLAKIALSFAAIVAAIQVMAGMMAVLSSTVGLIMGVVTLFGTGGALAGVVAAIGAAAPVVGVILLIVAALALLVGGFIYAYQHSEEFRDRVDAAIDAVAGYFEGFMERVGEVFSGIRGFFEEAARIWGIILTPVVTFFRTVIGPTIVWFYRDIIKPTFEFIGGVFRVFWDIVRKLGDIFYQVIVKVIAPIFAALYKQYIKPVWDNQLKPLFEAIGRFIEDHVAPAFQKGRDLIGSIWAGLIELAKAPIDFFVNFVINKGIIDNFNKLANVFPGIDPIEHVKLPWSDSGKKRGGGGGAGVPVRRYATGGMLPGYTPGRDVHTFYSPTAGVLELSGGEPVLRPEAGRVLGRDWVDGINAAARTGGQGGVQRFLGGFAGGGFLGGAGDWLGRIGRGAGAVVGNIGDAIGNIVGSVSDLIKDPTKVLRAIVDRLLGKDPKGLLSIGKGAAYSLIDGIARILPGSSEGGEPTPGGSAPGWQAMSAIIQAAFPSARISSAFRKGAVTAVGTRSYHALGRAIDIVPPSMAVFDWLSRMYPNSSELLYSPAENRQILRRGMRGNTSGVTRSMHYNHVHWALAQGGVIPKLYDDGGTLPPGMHLIANKTGKPEQVLTQTQWDQIKRGGDTVNHWEIGHMGADAHEVAAELDRMRLDRLVVAGLNAAEQVG